MVEAVSPLGRLTVGLHVVFEVWEKEKRLSQGS